MLQGFVVLLCLPWLLLMPYIAATNADGMRRQIPPFFPSSHPQFDYQLVLINEWQLKKQALDFSCNQRNQTKDLLEKQSLQQEPVWATSIYSASSCQQEVSPTDDGLQLDFFALGMNTKSQGICNSF